MSLRRASPLNKQPLDPQTNKFNADSAKKLHNSKNLKLKNCYLEGSLGKDGKTREWKVVTTKHPWASKIYRFFKGLGKKTKFIADKEFESYAKTAALANIGKEGPLDTSTQRDPIATNKEFSAFLQRDVVEIKEAKAKTRARWMKAAEKIKILTKGAIPVTSKEFLGQTKTLDEHYWQEALHPSHKYGGDLNKLFEDWKASGSTLNFDDYLAENNLITGGGRVKYMDEEQRVPSQVTIVDGKLMKDDRPLDTQRYMDEEGAGSSDFNPIYVISPSGEMYVDIPFVEQFHHSSFLSGAPVLGAGAITTNPEGVIIRISNESGHYKPGKKQLISTLRYLQKQGVDLSKVEVVERTDKVKIYKNAKSYLDKKGEIPEDGYVSDDAGSVYFEHDETSSTIIFPDHQFSRADKKKFCAKLSSLHKGAEFKKVKLHLGFNAYVIYDLQDFVDSQHVAKVIEIDGAQLEKTPNGVLLKIDKKFDKPMDRLQWTSQIIQTLFNTGQFDMEKDRIAEKSDKGYEEPKLYSEFIAK